MRTAFAAALVLGLVTTACATDDDYGPICYAPLQGEIDPSGIDHQYVVDSITVPQNAEETFALGMNLDGDDQGRPDNALGALLVVLAEASASLDFQTAATDGVTRGDVIPLVNIQATDITMATGVGVWFYPGTNPSVDPCSGPSDTVCGRHLDGSSTFEVEADASTSERVVGFVIGGRLTAGPGSVAIEIPLLPNSPPIRLALVGTRLEIDQTSEDTLAAGVLAGALTGDNLLQAVAALVNAILDEACVEPSTVDAPCGCPAAEMSQLVAALDGLTPDCRIDASEITMDDLVGTSLEPDVDLFDEDGTFFPRYDEIADSVSFGVGFTAVGATFDRPDSICP